MRGASVDEVIIGRADPTRVPTAWIRSAVDRKSATTPSHGCVRGRPPHRWSIVYRRSVLMNWSSRCRHSASKLMDRFEWPYDSTQFHQLVAAITASLDWTSMPWCGPHLELNARIPASHECCVLPRTLEATSRHRRAMISFMRRTPAVVQRPPFSPGKPSGPSSIFGVGRRLSKHIRSM